MEQPLYYWDPVIAPSGMVFYTGSLFPGLEGQPVHRRPSARNDLVRLTLDGEKVVGEERLLKDLQPKRERIRDVRAGSRRRALPADRQREGPAAEAGAEEVTF